jgi:hypothetical protein
VFFSLLAALAFGLVGAPALLPTSQTVAAPWADKARPETRHTVFLAGGLQREQIITLAATLAASEHPGILLIDSDTSAPHHNRFLNEYRPEVLVPVGAYQESDPTVAGLAEVLNGKVAPVVSWKEGAPLELWQQLFPKAERVVVCPAKPYRQLLQAACLAGAARAPLYVLHGKKGEPRELRRLLETWETKTLFAVGAAEEQCSVPAGVEVVTLANESAVAAEHLRRLLTRGAIHTMVIANPSDIKAENAAMSPLAPWIASQRRAPLLLTNGKGDNVVDLVNAATKKRDLRRVDNLLFVADLTAIPMEQRENPIPDGKDPTIDMEPLTPRGEEPFSFATGRLFHQDPSVVALMLARERLMARARHAQHHTRRALLCSNAMTTDDAAGLPLLETFSRNTAAEFRNRGYDTTTLFGKQVKKDALRSLLPEADVFLWEGHHNTLIKEFQVHEWGEPLQPSMIFLQSCLALKDYKAQPILERGAMCVVGSSTRIYSASGGAFALCFFDSLMYENQTAGASLRQAKNFLLAYSLLKQKRLGKDAKLSMANLRSAWAFTLWGDPTLRLLPPEAPADALPAVTHKVDGNTIHLYLPTQAHEKATTTRFKAEMLPNGRLAGLISKQTDDKLQKVVPFVFAEVSLPNVSGNKVPKLTTKLPTRRWVFVWDARRRAGYLLAAPRSTDEGEIRFHVGTEPRAVAGAETETDSGIGD